MSDPKRLLDVGSQASAVLREVLGSSRIDAPQAYELERLRGRLQAVIRPGPVTPDEDGRDPSPATSWKKAAIAKATVGAVVVVIGTMIVTGDGDPDAGPRAVRKDVPSTPGVHEEQTADRLQDQADQGFDQPDEPRMENASAAGAGPRSSPNHAEASRPPSKPTNRSAWRGRSREPETAPIQHAFAPGSTPEAGAKPTGALRVASKPSVERRVAAAPNVMSGDDIGASPAPEIGQRRDPDGHSGAPSRPETPLGDSLSMEAALLVRARYALQKRRFKRALGLTDRHMERFPDGLLAEEREAIAIEALIDLGRRDRARSRFERLRIDHPQSSYAGRLERRLAH
jgi:hypothetical protein